LPTPTTLGDKFHRRIAFGYIAYPPRPDGEPTFNEGYIFDGDGDLIPARVVEAPVGRRRDLREGAGQ
jgi:hypothetical protein